MPLFPKSYGATPTWGGLLVKGLDGKGTVTLVQWDRLEEGPRGCWYVRDPDGCRLKHDRREVRVWVNGDRAMQLAHRSYCHHLKPAWNSGQLQLTLACSRHCLGLWFMALLCLASGIAMTCLTAERSPELWNPDPPFPDSRHLVLSRMIIAAWFLASAALIGVGTWLLPWKRWRPNVRRVLIDRQGMHTQSVDSAERLITWNAIREIKRSMKGTRIGVVDQEPIIIPHECPRPPAWNHFFTASLPREIIERQERKRRNAGLRVCIWLTLGISLYIPAVWLVADHPTLTPVQVVLIATAIYVAMGSLLIGLAHEKAIRRRLRTMQWRRRRHTVLKPASGTT